MYSIAANCTRFVHVYNTYRSIVNPPRTLNRETLIWIHGPSGCGKSAIAREAFTGRYSLKAAGSKFFPPGAALDPVLILEDMDLTSIRKDGMSISLFK